MRIAFLADVHSNLEALTACLADAERRGAERFVFLGDLVGYGADPEWTMDAVMALAENGAVAVRGNHDTAVGLASDTMNADAQAAIEWTPARSIMAAPAQIGFCGHIHRPALYSMSSTAKMTSFVPTADVPVQLLQGRRWLAVIGSVGQPRDSDPAASFAMFDTERRELTYCRAAYDIEAAAARIRANGLPGWLADRLFVGR